MTDQELFTADVPGRHSVSRSASRAEGVAAAAVAGELFDESGLDQEQVRQRLADGRDNRTVQPTSRSAWSIVRANVLTRFNALLGALCVLVLVVGPVQDALFGLVVIANSAVGIVAEMRAKRTLDRLQVLTATGINAQVTQRRKVFTPSRSSEGGVVN